MATTRTQAARLLNASEMALFNASRDRATKELPAKRLESKVRRARNLRDKYRDLHKRQTRALRGRPWKAPRAGPPNERTARKAEILDDVLQRLQQQADQRKAGEQRATKRKTARKPGATRKAAAPKRGAARKAAARPAVRGKTARPSARRKAGAGKARPSARRAPSKVPARSTAELVERKRAAQARQLAARTMELSPKAPSHGAPSPHPAGDGEGQVQADGSRFDIAGAAAIQGHVKSASRRNQAARDRR